MLPIILSEMQKTFKIIDCCEKKSDFHNICCRYTTGRHFGIINDNAIYRDINEIKEKHKHPGLYCVFLKSGTVAYVISVTTREPFVKQAFIASLFQVKVTIQLIETIRFVEPMNEEDYKGEQLSDYVEVMDDLDTRQYNEYRVEYSVYGNPMAISNSQINNLMDMASPDYTANDDIDEPINEPVGSSTIEPTIDELTIDEPIDEPINNSTSDEPINDEPTIDEPMSKSTIDEPMSKSSINEPMSKSTINEPIIEEPIIEEPINEPMSKSTNELLDELLDDSTKDSINNDTDEEYFIPNDFL